jgi:hypothetical protein
MIANLWLLNVNTRSMIVSLIERSQIISEGFLVKDLYYINLNIREEQVGPLFQLYMSNDQIFRFKVER